MNLLHTARLGGEKILDKVSAKSAVAATLLLVYAQFIIGLT